MGASEQKSEVMTTLLPGGFGGVGEVLALSFPFLFFSLRNYLVIFFALHRSERRWSAAAAARKVRQSFCAALLVYLFSHPHLLLFSFLPSFPSHPPFPVS
ncbi:hypothetical protein HDK77DRAFT_435576 [Phyllosticta capitalensis]|uniref:uncharacterized protein n=1 Tax=Phyllosticta capitalensis TaxID=121624 RepID=UPI00312FC870